MQTENRLFDDLARMANGAINTLSGVREEIESRLRERVERWLAEMDMVPREEFEAIKELAQKARAEQEDLTAKVAALEQKIAAMSAASDTAAQSPKKQPPAASPQASQGPSPRPVVARPRRSRPIEHSAVPAAGGSATTCRLAAEPSFWQSLSQAAAAALLSASVAGRQGRPAAAPIEDARPGRRDRL